MTMLIHNVPPMKPTNRNVVGFSLYSYVFDFLCELNPYLIIETSIITYTNEVLEGRHLQFFTPDGLQLCRLT